jgi:hypothetical protein
MFEEKREAVNAIEAVALRPVPVKLKFRPQ